MSKVSEFCAEIKLKTYTIVFPGDSTTLPRADNFTTVSGRKACSMSKVSKFCAEKKLKTYMLVTLNILCLICINHHRT